MISFFHGAGPIGTRLTAISLVALSSCSDQASVRTDESLTVLRSGERTYPQGTATVLSVTGPMALPEAEPFETAVNCAAAIHVTTQMISQMPVGVDARQIELLRQAERIYRERAAEVSNADARESGPAAIEQRLSEVQSRAQSQAQLAVNCVRNLSAS